MLIGRMDDFQQPKSTKNASRKLNRANFKKKNKTFTKKTFDEREKREEEPKIFSK